MGVNRNRAIAALLLFVLMAQTSAIPMLVKRVGVPAFAEEVFRAEVEKNQTQDAGDQLSGDAMNLLQVEILRDAQTAPVYADKRILIYHTHTYEAYEPTPEHPYKALEKWRTDDAEHNVTAIGDMLTAALHALGFEVVHDRTAFEPPSHDTAYERSLAMLDGRAAKGEKYDLYIDLHRDAISASSTIKRTVTIGGEKVARFMVVIGKGTTGGYVQKPNWEANLAIAECITASLNEQCESLARDVKIKTGRFNQHIADQCVLIECGMNCNTLEEVQNGIPYLAQAIASVFAQEKSAE